MTFPFLDGGGGVTFRGANRNPKSRNSEIVRIPIRYSDGQQQIFSDNFGQTQLPSNFFREIGKLVAYLVVFIMLNVYL